MKRNVLVAVLVILSVLVIGGCSLNDKSDKDSTSFKNDIEYSTVNGDTPPIDVGNVRLTYAISTPVTAGDTALTISGELTNNTGATLVDSYIITVYTSDGSFGNMMYMGNIDPGATVNVQGVLSLKDPNKTYVVGDLMTDNILTSVYLNDHQKATISADFKTGVTSWDCTTIEL